MRTGLIFLGLIALTAVLWFFIVLAHLLYPAAVLIGGFLLVLIGVGVYQTGSIPASREASARLAQEKQAERDLYAWRWWA